MKLSRFIANGIREFNTDTITGLFLVQGSFGMIDGLVNYDEQKTDNGVVYSYQTDKVLLRAEFTFFADGGVLRRDTVKNISSEDITAYRLTSRFTLEGGEYDVFTQSNCWQHEGVGRWSTLATQITTESTGVRTCESASPLTALFNKQNGKVTVFYLFPNCQWKINVARKSMPGIRDTVTVETGLNDAGLRMLIKAGETINLPEIFFYECEDKVGLGSHILHNYYNNAYPRKKLPAIYNTWLYKFTAVDFDDLVKQADIAKDLGFEYFAIDAGWFGEEGKSWVETVGDWFESPVTGFKGKMKEFSNYVRSLGLKFGLWVEPERASKGSNNYNKNPEHYISKDFLSDYANPEVVDKLFSIICRLVDTYNVEYFKFDFNRTVGYDEYNSAFYRYMQGQRAFVEKIRQRYPNIYLTNCASGGFRIDLEQAKFFDSFWITDNQGPVEGLRIYTELIKRVPASIVETYNVQKAVKGLPVNDCEDDVIISCNDANWKSLAHVEKAYPFNFLSGGPIGYSCDLNFPEWYKKDTKEFLSNYASDVEFWKNANVRILVNTDNQVVLQYANDNFDKVVIHYFTKTVTQDQLTIFPVVDKNANYLLDGNTVSGLELALDGYTFTSICEYDCKTLVLNKVK